MNIDKINNTPINNNSFENAKNTVSEDKFEKVLQSAFDKKDEKQLKKACQEFEGIILNMMYKQMKAAIPKSDLIPSDTGKDIFSTMLDEKLMEEAAKSNRVGMADALYKQLSKRLNSSYKPSSGGSHVETDQSE
ncbi:MAG: rod-binding protein [Clostridia bacterium]|nr:rod-binding protein [Clostridia bacterium]